MTRRNEPEILRLLREINGKADRIMSEQSQIDTVTDQINAEVADEDTKDAAILAAQQQFVTEIAALQTQVNNGQPVSLTNLLAAAQSMLTAQGADDSTVAALTAAANPAPVTPPASS